MRDNVNLLALSEARHTASEVEPSATSAIPRNSHAEIYPRGSSGGPSTEEPERQAIERAEQIAQEGGKLALDPGLSDLSGCVIGEFLARGVEGQREDRHV